MPVLIATFTATIRVLPEDQEPGLEPVTEQTIQNLIGHTGAQVIEVSDLDGASQREGGE